MAERHEEIPEGEEQMRELEEDLEHLEEDVEKRGFFSKMTDLFTKLVAPSDPTEREQHDK